ncbi:MAG: AMP-binding protein [Clostridiales bacterium]|jgi:acetyl-CoA synthetase|nr:AMP-binding protein [Clostridiales bacterium]
MNLLGDFLNEIEFKDYDDFSKNLKISVKDGFNFGYDVVDKYAALAPEKRALVWCDDKGAEKIITFKELAELSDKAAAVMQKYGAEKGDFIMTMLNRRYEYWVVAVAAHKIGAVIIPATCMLTPKDIIYRCNSADVKMIFSVNEEEILSHLKTSLPDCPTLKHIFITEEPHNKTDKTQTTGGSIPQNTNSENAQNETDKTRQTGGSIPQNTNPENAQNETDKTRQNGGSIPQNANSENTGGGFISLKAELQAAPAKYQKIVNKNSDMMLVYFTSGTTGYPKMVAHDFTYPLGHIINAKYWHGVLDDGLHFTMAETGWAKFSWGKIYGQWIAGSAVFGYDYYGRFTPTDILPLLSKYKITTFCAPPTIYRFLVKEDLSGFDLSSVKHCSTAGEPLNAEIFNQFDRITGLKIHEGFGQSESAVIAGTFTCLTPKQGSMGRPSPVYKVDLIGDDGEPVPNGAIGELAILNKKDNFSLLMGYHKDKEKTDAALAGKYYGTGDLAYADADGYLWFVGRKDDIIKSSGYRIGPFEVESALHEHPSVLECAITAVPDPLRGQIVKATIVLAKGFTPSDGLKKELQEHVKKATAPYKYPRIIEFVDALPKTVSGKVMRKDIRKKDENR